MIGEYNINVNRNMNAKDMNKSFIKTEGFRLVSLKIADKRSHIVIIPIGYSIIGIV